MIDDASEIQAAWLDGVTCAAITAGASAPENLVQEVVDFFEELGVEEVEEVEIVQEKVTFVPPPELTREMDKRSATR